MRPCCTASRRRRDGGEVVAGGVDQQQLVVEPLGRLGDGGVHGDRGVEASLHLGADVLAHVHVPGLARRTERLEQRQRPLVARQRTGGVVAAQHPAAVGLVIETHGADPAANARRQLGHDQAGRSLIAPAVVAALPGQVAFDDDGGCGVDRIRGLSPAADEGGGSTAVGSLCADFIESPAGQRREVSFRHTVPVDRQAIIGPTVERDDASALGSGHPATDVGFVLALAAATIVPLMLAAA